MTRCMCVLATCLVLLAAVSARAALPAPGSTYHLLFATSNSYRTTSTTSIPPPGGRFGSIAAADYQVTSSAFDAQLPGTLTWDGVSPLYRAILSITGDNARDRLSVSGPVFNLHGTELASGHADLFDGSLAAAVDYDELGTLITSDSDVWTGSTSVGTAAGGLSCGTWNNTSNASGGGVGSENDSDGHWISTGLTQNCNRSARLYGLSPALTAPLWGDYDGSGAVDGGDFLAWQPSWASRPAPRS